MNQAPVGPSARAWLDAARVAIVDVARHALGQVARLGSDQSLGPDLAGAMVPILSERAQVQIGLFSTDAGCEALARALLGTPPHEHLGRAQVVDAVGELANMLSGNVKARIARHAEHAVLGLPTFVHGSVEARTRQVVDVLPVTIGGAIVHVVVVQGG